PNSRRWIYEAALRQIELLDLDRSTERSTGRVSLRHRPELALPAHGPTTRGNGAEVKREARFQVNVISNQVDVRIDARLALRAGMDDRHGPIVESELANAEIGARTSG